LKDFYLIEKMPKSEKYLSGFGLERGSYLEGYHLKDIKINHVTVKRYREYTYPTILIWEVYDRSSNLENFKSHLESYLSDDRVIYTQYGNPYQCQFGTLTFSESGNEIKVSAEGRCVRI